MAKGKQSPEATTLWKSRIIGHGSESPEQLLANPWNARRHPGPQRDAMRGSLDAVGWVAEVTVNVQTQHVVDGHLRIEEAISHNEPTVPVTYVDLTEEEERLVLATLDPLSAMATYDTEALMALLDGLSSGNAGLDALLGDLAGKGGSSFDAKLNEWGGMPDFGQEDLLPFKRLLVDFLRPEDVEAFAQLTGQKITLATRSIWFPMQETSHPIGNIRFVADGDEPNPEEGEEVEDETGQQAVEEG